MLNKTSHSLNIKQIKDFTKECLTQDDEEDFGTGKFAKYQKIMWDLIEKPDTSTAASVISIMSTVFVAVSIVGMTISTLPSLQYEVRHVSVAYIFLIKLLTRMQEEIQWKILALQWWKQSL